MKFFISIEVLPKNMLLLVFFGLKMFNKVLRQKFFMHSLRMLLPLNQTLKKQQEMCTLESFSIKYSHILVFSFFTL